MAAVSGTVVMNFTLIACAIAAAIGFGSAWKWQASNITEMERDHANERLGLEVAARTALEANTQRISRATDEANARLLVLSRERDAAARAVSGLRSATNTALSSVGNSIGTCTEYSTTVSELLNKCSQRYTDVAGLADGHVGDVKTLKDGWPK